MDPPADGHLLPDVSRKVLDSHFARHWAEIVAATLITVNALGCAPRRVPAPDREGRLWPTYLADLTRAPSADQTLPASLEVAWTAGTGKSAAGALALGDSVVVVQSSDRLLTLLRRRTGERAWRARLDGPGATGPLFTHDRVYTASGDVRGRVYQYDLHTGKRTWARLVGPVVGPIAISDRRVFAATGAGWLYALDPSNGDVDWRRSFGAPLRAGVSIVGPNVVVATDDSLFLVTQLDGQVSARGATEGPVFSPPAISDSLLVVSSPAGYVAAFDPRTLVRRWRASVAAPVFGSPVIARDTVFTATMGGRFWKIPLGDPGSALSVDLQVPVRAAPTPIEGGVLIGTIEGELILLTSGSDDRHWRERVYAPIEEPPIVDQGMVLVADGRGRIHAWREREEEGEERER